MGQEKGSHNVLTLLQRKPPPRGFRGSFLWLGGGCGGFVPPSPPNRKKNPPSFLRRAAGACAPKTRVHRSRRASCALPPANLPPPFSPLALFFLLFSPWRDANAVPFGPPTFSSLDAPPCGGVETKLFFEREKKTLLRRGVASRATPHHFRPFDFLAIPLITTCPLVRIFLFRMRFARDLRAIVRLFKKKHHPTRFFVCHHPAVLLFSSPNFSTAQPSLRCVPATLSGRFSCVARCRPGVCAGWAHHAGSDPRCSPPPPSRFRAFSNTIVFRVFFISLSLP